MDSSHDIGLSQAEWSPFEEMVLELALLANPEGTSDRWSRISANFSRKSPEQVLYHHYQILKDDLKKEEGGNSGDGCSMGMAPEQRPPKDQNTSLGSGRRGRERRKAKPWTEEEHRYIYILLYCYYYYCFKKLAIQSRRTTDWTSSTYSIEEINFSIGISLKKKITCTLIIN